MRHLLLAGLLLTSAVALAAVDRKSGNPNQAVQNGVSSTAPTVTTTTGLQYFDTITNTLRCWNGSAWAECNPGSGTSSGASGTTQVSNGSGGFTAITRQKIYCGYADLDANLDGQVEDRTMWDYDCDSTQELSDWQTGIDNQCDFNGDSTQDGTAADYNGDGTVGTQEKRCGAFNVAPGIYTTTSPTERLNIKWKWLKVNGAGRDATLLKTAFARAAYCVTKPLGRTGIVQALDLDGATGAADMDQRGPDYVELSNFGIQGLGQRVANASNPSIGSYEDCDSDGTLDDDADGTNDGSEGLNDILIMGAAADTPGGSAVFDRFDYVDYWRFHDISMVDCDGACFFILVANYTEFDNIEARNSSEHCYGLGGQHGRFTNFLGRNCGNGSKWVGGGLTVGSTDFQSSGYNLFSHFDVAGIMGIRVEHADNTGVTPIAYPANVNLPTRIEHGIVTANDTLHTGSGDLGYGFWDNTCATCVSRDYDISDVKITASSVGVYMNRYSKNFRFNGVQVLGSNWDYTGTNSVLLSGIDTSFSNGDISLGDINGDSTFDSGAGVQVVDCTRCTLDHTHIHGTNNPSATYRSGVVTETTATFFTAADNQVDLQLDSTANTNTTGFYNQGGDDGNYLNNIVRFSAADDKTGFFIGSGNTSERNRYIGNAVYGGRNSFLENLGARNIGMNNHAAPTYITTSPGPGFTYAFNNYNSPASSVWAFNTCIPPDNSPCFRFGAAATRAVGNYALTALTGTANPRDITTTVNTVDIATQWNSASVNTGLWVGGTDLQERAVCMSGTNVTDLLDACIAPTNPTGQRQFRTPDASGFWPVSTRVAANGNQMVWANKGTACSTVCTNTWGPGATCINTIPDNAGPVGNCTDTTTGAAYHWCLCQ